MSATWVAIVLAAVGTFAFRFSFLAFADRLVDLPRSLTRVLEQIPPAALAALTIPALLSGDDGIDFWQPRLAAGLVAAAVIYKTRNVALTLVVGLGTLVAIEQLIL